MARSVQLMVLKGQRYFTFGDGPLGTGFKTVNDGHDRMKELYAERTFDEGERNQAIALLNELERPQQQEQPPANNRRRQRWDQPQHVIH